MRPRGEEREAAEQPRQLRAGGARLPRGAQAARSEREQRREQRREQAGRHPRKNGAL